MKIQTVKIFISLLAFAAFAFGQQTSAVKTADSKFDASKARTVPYCELMRKPEDFVGKPIRLAAVFTNVPSLGSIFYVECEPKVSAIPISLADDNFDILSPEVLSKMSEKKIDGAMVTVVGKFLEIPRKPDSKDSEESDAKKYMFEIHALEKVERVPQKK